MKKKLWPSASYACAYANACTYGLQNVLYILADGAPQAALIAANCSVLCARSQSRLHAYARPTITPALYRLASEGDTALRGYLLGVYLGGLAIPQE